MLSVFNPPTGDYLLIPGLMLAAVALGAIGILATRKKGKKSATGKYSAGATRSDDSSGGGGAA